MSYLEKGHDYRRRRVLQDWIYAHRSSCCHAGIEIAWYPAWPVPAPDGASKVCLSCGQLCEGVARDGRLIAPPMSALDVDARGVSLFKGKSPPRAGDLPESAFANPFAGLLGDLAVGQYLMPGIEAQPRVERWTHGRRPRARRS